MVVVGNRTRVKVVKNKMAPPFREAEFDILYGKGVSRSGEVVDMAVDLTFIQKNGAWYSVGPERIGQGRDNARQYLEEHPETMAKLEAQIMAHYEIGKAEIGKAEAAKNGASVQPVGVSSSAASAAAASKVSPSSRDDADEESDDESSGAGAKARAAKANGTSRAAAAASGSATSSPAASSPAAKRAGVRAN
jgi:recombination protein RecA